MARADRVAAEPGYAAGMIEGRGAAASGWQAWLPSWPLLIGLAVLARLLAARTALLHDPDTYLHIAAGRWIIAHRALPVHDPFSHSLPGATWISSEWLVQIVLAGAFDTLGWGGVIVLTALAAALALGLLTHFLLRRLDPLPALIAAVGALALLEPHMLARPHLLALPLLVVWAGLLLGARDDGRPPPWAVLAVMPLWASLHGSFLFGLAFAAFLAGEAVMQPGIGRSRLAEARAWGLFVAAAIVAALLTPHGLAGLVQPLQLTRMPALHATFAEWQSPDFQHAAVLEAWILGLVFLGFAAGVRLGWTRLVLLLGLVHMTLQHGRHGDILAIVAPLALAGSFAAPLRAMTATPAPSRLLVWAGRLARPPGAPAVIAVTVLAVALALPTALAHIERPDDAVTPGAALAAARSLGITGPVFNSEGFGGYLVFAGVPTFIDGRIEMYGNDFLAEDYQAERGGETALTGILDRYHIAWTLLIPEAGAVGILDHLPGWHRVYGDAHAVVHVRTAAGS